MIKLIYIDLFCGAGGTSTGVSSARLNGEQCAEVIACVNHDVNAIASHVSKSPRSTSFYGDIGRWSCLRLFPTYRAAARRPPVRWSPFGLLSNVRISARQREASRATQTAGRLQNTCSAILMLLIRITFKLRMWKSLCLGEIWMRKESLSAWIRADCIGDGYTT